MKISKTYQLAFSKSNCLQFFKNWVQIA